MEILENILLVAPVLLFSVVAHEIAHGWAARTQGDPTAYELGRLSWNPARHLDPFMSVILPLMLMVASGGRVMLGGAKPVPVDPRNYRHYRRGDIIVSLAGVFTNLLIALACAALIVVTGAVGRQLPSAGATMGILQAMLVYGVLLNFGLIAFNLIPIPPLDGSHVVKHLLPRAWAVRYVEVSRYGIFLLIALISFGAGLLEGWMRPARRAALALIRSVDGAVLPSALQWLP